MKKLLTSLLFTTAICIAADAQVRMPAPSPTQTLKQDFGISSIELTYSRPSLKGRKMIGDVEQFGKIWRTGANAATKIRFNDAVEIGGKAIDSGTYVLYTIPEKNDDWTIILNKGLSNWGIDGYQESQDVARFKAKTMKLNPAMETLTMQFGNIRPESCELHIMWEDYAVNIPIKTSFVDKVGLQLNDALKSAKPPYWEAAQYYYEYNKDLPKALEMTNKAITMNAAMKPFWILHYKAKIQKDLGDKAGAIATANESNVWAKEAKNDAYVMMNDKLIKELK